MNNYQFIIGIDLNGFDVENRKNITKYGYKDTEILYRKGNIFLEFNRKDKTFSRAVVSAIETIESTGMIVTSIFAAEGGL